MRVYEMDLGEWQQMLWWPTGTAARIHVGTVGHDQEIVVNLDAYPDVEHPVNDIVFAALREALPETWKLEDRTTRVEIHPSGRLFGGFCEDDVAAVRRALEELGFRPISVIRR